MSTTYTKPLPLVTHLTKPFWDGTKRHELVIQKCKKCSSYLFPPTPTCRECGSMDLEWTKTSGKGTVYTYTTVYQDLNRGFSKDVPYVLALVELDEGARMYSILTNKPEEVKIGSRVSITFEDATLEISIYKFKIE